VTGYRSVDRASFSVYAPYFTNTACARVRKRESGTSIRIRIRTRTYSGDAVIHTHARTRARARAREDHRRVRKVRVVSIVFAHRASLANGGPGWARSPASTSVVGIPDKRELIEHEPGCRRLRCGRRCQEARLYRGSDRRPSGSVPVEELRGHAARRRPGERKSVAPLRARLRAVIPAVRQETA
jgi:hypothetical protein